MGDVEKIEQLLPKLIHFLPDVRLRASNNLLFKLESGLLGNILFNNSTYVQLLVEGVHKSIKMIVSTDEWKKESESTEARTLEVLFLTIKQMVRYNSSSDAVSMSYVSLLQNLYHILSIKALDAKATSALKEVSDVIQCMYILPSCIYS